MLRSRSVAMQKAALPVWRVQRGLPLAVLVLCGLFVGCTSINDTMQSWVGSHQHDLILSWGPPTRSTSDGADGWILIYEYDRNGGQIPGKAYRGADGATYYTAPQNTGYTAQRMFYVHSDGIIYSWRWQGI
jgi:hypothetical protein